VITLGTTESWLCLMVAVAVGMWPVMVAAGMVWGRMQAEDEMLILKRRARAASDPDA
jgi:hypothetical protein